MYVLYVLKISLFICVSLLSWYFLFWWGLSDILTPFHSMGNFYWVGRGFWEFFCSVSSIGCSLFFQYCKLRFHCGFKFISLMKAGCVLIDLIFNMYLDANHFHLSASGSVSFSNSVEGVDLIYPVSILSPCYCILLILYTV